MILSTLPGTSGYELLLIHTVTQSSSPKPPGRVILTEVVVYAARFKTPRCCVPTFARPQKRAHFVNHATETQYARLHDWTEEHRGDLWQVCAPGGQHVMLLELSQALISYQDHHMLCFSSCDGPLFRARITTCYASRAVTRATGGGNKDEY